MEIILKQDKTTKNAIRFVEDSNDHPIAIYLTKIRVKELGEPSTLKLTIEPA